MLTKEELSPLSDEDLSLLLSSLKSEKAAREKRKSCVQKGDAAKSMKRDMRCPHCLCRLRKDGRRKKTAPKGTNARFAAVIRAIQRAHHCHPRNSP